MINLGLVTEFNKIKHVALPSLLLAKQISPWHNYVCHYGISDLQYGCRPDVRICFSF